uniref:Uncharacterized protein n=1 Tax=Anguilla anguilla TaxID=7936 RepID=A0A0E9SFI6_ANGAN
MIAQPLQPQATLFKILIEVGTNEFLKTVECYIGVLYIVCQRVRADIRCGEYEMGQTIFSVLA